MSKLADRVDQQMGRTAASLRRREATMTEQEWLASTDPAAMLTQATQTLNWKGPRPSDRKLRLFACGCCRITQSMQYQEAQSVVAVAETVADDGDLKSGGMSALQTARNSIEAIGGWFWCVTNPDIAVGLRLTLDEETRENGGGYGNANGLYSTQMANLLRSIIGNPFAPVTLPFKQDCLRDSFGLRCNVHTGLTQHCSKPPRCGGCRRDWVCPWLTPTVRSLATAAYEQRAGRVCGRCGGKWRTIEGYSTCEVQVGDEPVRWRRCPACHGTGRVEDGTLDPQRLAVLSDALEDAGCEDETVLRWLRGEERCGVCGGKGSLGDSGGRLKKRQHGSTPCHSCETGWCPRQTPSYRGDWCLDLLLGKG